MVIGLAGRRVDVVGANPGRFDSDPQNIERVRRRLHAMFVREGARVLISSAACGADLLALEEADKLGLRRRIVLPFNPAKFRETSVVDRPGDWGPLYDKTIEEVASRGDLVVLDSEYANDAFIRVNHAIIEEAISLGESLRCPVSVVLVWEGKSRGEGDLTEDFRLYAESRRVPFIEDVLTVGPQSRLSGGGILH